MQKKKVTRVASYGLILNDQKILLCRLSRNVKDSPGKWTLPGGGIEFGENPPDAMVREVFEETGLSVNSHEIAGINSILINKEEGAFHGIRIIYFASYISGHLVDEKDGTTDKCQWFSFEEAKKLPLVELAEEGILLASNSMNK